jgi:hypothetical protein
MTLARILNLPGLLSRKSFFLFGPRATGKSTLIKQQSAVDGYGYCHRSTGLEVVSTVAKRTLLTLNP